MDKRSEIIKQMMQTPGFGWEEWGDPINSHLWRMFQSANMRLDTTIYLLQYLWPHFVEIDGLILREEDDPWTIERLQKYRDQAANLRPEQIEFLINHLHLLELFRNAPAMGQGGEMVWRYFAENVADMWRGRLTQLFPEKQFHIEVVEGYGLEIWVWTIRDESAASPDD